MGLCPDAPKGASGLVSVSPMLGPLGAPIGGEDLFGRWKLTFVMETIIENESSSEDQELMGDILRKVPDALDRLHSRYRHCK